MRRHVVHLFAATLVAGTVAALPITAQADAVAPTAAQLSNALGLPAGVSVTYQGDPSAAIVATKPFDDFPRQSPVGATPATTYGQDGQYVVMSTGKAAQIFDETDLGPSRQPSTDLGDPDDGDVASLTLTAAASASNRCLLVDVAMATEERVHTYTTSTPSDTISLTLNGEDTQYAKQPGNQYFSQSTSLAKPVDYSVNAINYWHKPGDENDRAVGDQLNPWVDAAATSFDHVTTVETLEVPLPAGQDNAVDLAIGDANNDFLDSAALVDRVRVTPKCSTDSSATTGITSGEFVIRGDRGVGNTLTIDPIPSTDAVERYDGKDNGWYAGASQGVDLRFRWYRAVCVNALVTDMSKWTPIPDADRQSYVPTAVDKDKCLLALVTGKKDGWRTETFPSPTSTQWTSTLKVGNGVFVDVRQPLISQQTVSPDGKIRVGDTLAASVADWGPRQDTFLYQWGTIDPTSSATVPTKIVGATSANFVVTSAQAGKKLVVTVTARRLNFDDRASASALTSIVVPQLMDTTPKPTVEGQRVAASTVTASPGTWQPDGVKFAYQWYRDGQIETAAKTANLVLKADWVGSSMQVQVTGTKAGYESVSVMSDPFTVGGASMTGATPTITGTAKVGATLTGATATTWSPSGSTLTYIWKTSSGVTLQSGLKKTLVVPSSAFGKTISLTIQGSKAGYITATRTSTATATVKAGALTPGRAIVSGRAKVGVTLRAVTSGWNPAPVKLTYRWYANGKPVSGAVKSSFKIPSWAKGRTLKVKVTGTKTGYASTYKVSASTAKVVK